jgi:hypothetical protein
MDTQLITTSLLNIDKLPSELVFEITRHLEPKDYVSLYRTNKCLREILSYKPEYHNNMIKYLKERFIEISKYYLAFKEISVFDFDYFAENNNVGYDGVTESFKKRYELYAKAHIHKDFKFNLNTYVTCMAANESFSGLSLNVRYDMDYALKFSEFAGYSDENITDEAKKKLRKIAISTYLNRLRMHHLLAFLDLRDKFLYTTRDRFRTNKRIKFTASAMRYGSLAMHHHSVLKDIRLIATYLYGIDLPDDYSIEPSYHQLRDLFIKAIKRRNKRYKSSSGKFI